MQKRPSRDQLLEQASFALRTQQFSLAEQLAAEVLKASRTDNAATFIQAQALLAQNRGAEAIILLEKAALRSGDIIFDTLLGAALANAGRNREAIEQLQRTAARRPAYIPAFQQLAGQLANAGQADEAIAVLKDGLSLAPAAIDLQLDLARLHLDRNERAKAREILLTARDTAPDRSDILSLLARVFLLEGDLASAADAYRHSLARQPGDAMTRADFAACLLEMGEREAGEANLRLALRGSPQMLARATHALAASAHGRFFLRPSAVERFLQGKKV